MAILPVAMSNGSGFTISGADSNICTDNAVGGTWCYSNDGFTISTLKYLLNGVEKYTSTITGIVYVSLTTSTGSPNTGNSWSITYDDEAKILTIEWETSPQEGDGNCWLGINSSKSEPSPIHNGTGNFYTDHVTITAITESAVTKQALSGTATIGDKYQFSLGVSSSTTFLPPPPAYVRL